MVESKTARRSGRRWPPHGTERDQKEFDPPNARGIYPWLFLLGGPIWDTAHGRSQPLWMAIGGIFVFAAAWVLTVYYAFRPGSRRHRAARVALGIAMISSLVLTAKFGGAWYVMLPAAAIAIGVTVRGAAIVTVAGPFTVATAVLIVVTGASFGDTVTLTWGTFTSALIPWIILRLFNAIGELRRTREQLASAAVERERTRFSRDMHDLLGHTLSVMVVKAEAVRRVLPGNPDAAIQQAADIEQLGRQALVEVREAVSGYRGRGLRAELDAARAALTDAGITPTVRTTSLALDPETDALLGWAVREGVTNVIRHSGAKTCSIAVVLDDEQAVLEVLDDGVSVVSVNQIGNGLLGLRERAEALGGALATGPVSGGGFRLRIACPYAHRLATVGGSA